MAAALRPATSPPPRLSRRAWATDALLAIALTAGTVNDALSRADYSTDPGAPPGVPLPPGPAGPSPLAHHYGAAQPWQVLLAALTGLALVTRRRYPLATFWVVIGASQIYHLSPGFDPTFTFIVSVVAAFSASMYSPYQILATASTLVGAGLIMGTHKASVPSIRSGVVTFLLLIPIGIASHAIHTWKHRVRSLEEEQEAATRRAVEQERSRIARELHDVVTHNVSVMVVQAGAARKVIMTAPDQAEQAMLAVESGGRAAMTELRHVMGLLTMNAEDTDPAGTATLAPPPRLGQIASLAARLRSTGVPVELVVTGFETPLPAGVDLTAYRVVQEALTNTVKHAEGARVKIAIDYTPRMLRLEVTDTGGTRTAAARSGSGRGLIGLRERLSLYGGNLEAGEVPAGGYRVHAAIPLEDV